MKGEKTKVTYYAKADVLKFIDSYRYSTDVALHMLKHIDNIPTADVQQWVPVTERLPEKDIEVLVFAEGKIEGFFGDTAIAISKRYDKYKCVVVHPSNAEKLLEHYIGVKCVIKYVCPTDRIYLMKDADFANNVLNPEESA